ncbi:uncharacterized protein LOC143222198 isoform X2 [Tachypleus tridentatus]|uniref:uncharacterized protein LOC143222198 isoform X2 n=1 Tax=Tachypleus tridentatus TaxID=6853 RepID=UPI003FD1ADA5
MAVKLNLKAKVDQLFLYWLSLPEVQIVVQEELCKVLQFETKSNLKLVLDSKEQISSCVLSPPSNTPPSSPRGHTSKALGNYRNRQVKKVGR